MLVFIKITSNIIKKPYSVRLVYFCRVMIMRVNLFLTDSISISCPNSKQSDLHKYRPFSVEALYVLLLYPVNDFSKTLGKLLQ